MMEIVTKDGMYLRLHEVLSSQIRSGEQQHESLDLDVSVLVLRSPVCG